METHSYEVSEIERLHCALNKLSPCSTIFSDKERDSLLLLTDQFVQECKTFGKSVDVSVKFMEFTGRLVVVCGGVSFGGLDDFIIQGLFRDEHPFLISCANGDKTTSELQLLFESDLRCLQQIADVIRTIRHRGKSADPENDKKRTVTTKVTHNNSTGSVRMPWNLDGRRFELQERFWKSDNWLELIDTLCGFVRENGVGIFQGTPAFTLTDSEDRLQLQKVENFADFDLSWWHGNEARIETIEANTLDLLQGRSAHNVLIWGPRGCGKSSLIRGLITKYYDRGLRGIQIRQDQHERLTELYSLVRGRRERFIGVLDNISLEAHSTSFRQLATVLDGGLERAPSNLVFYATSNFKDLIDRDGETSSRPPAMQVDGFSAGEDGPQPQFYDPQQQQRLDERRAIDDRFALKVFLDFPTKSEYERLILAYAKRSGITYDASQILAAFNVWTMRHNHDLIGGRTARDFVQWYAARQRSGSEKA